MNKKRNFVFIGKRSKNEKRFIFSGDKRHINSINNVNKIIVKEKLITELDKGD